MICYKSWISSSRQFIFVQIIWNPIHHFNKEMHLFSVQVAKTGIWRWQFLVKILLRIHAKRPYFRFCRWCRNFLKSFICFGDKELNFVATPRMLPFPPRRAALLVATKNAKMIARTIWMFIFRFDLCSDISLLKFLLLYQQSPDVTFASSGNIAQNLLDGSYHVLIRQDF